MSKLDHHGNRERINFVKAALEAAATSCRIAQQADPTKRGRFITKARSAYEAGNRYMFRLNMGDAEFQRVAAVAEGVKFMLEELERECERRAVSRGEKKKKQIPTDVRKKFASGAKALTSKEAFGAAKAVP